MLSRRRFLGYSLAGAITTTVGCRPRDFDQISQNNTAPFNGTRFLKNKKGLWNRKKYFLGYPINMSTPPEEFFHWRMQLKKAGIGEFGYNNVGNPFDQSSIPYNTHDFEREIIIGFGKQYGFKSKDTWGFLSHSGTDSNMHGMYIGRTLLKGKTGVVPKCYFTDEAHYSVQILSDLLGTETIFVNTLSDASMDPEDLIQKLKKNEGYPALVVASIGTTFKGAIDPVDKIRTILEDHPSYLHLDAALFGGYLPHTLGAAEVQHILNKSEGKSRFDSIAISCHKFFGFPSPAGLFITSQSVYDEFHELYSMVHNPEYIGHVPGTITCSRDAVKPAEFYYYSTPEAIEIQARDARAILKNTEYLFTQMYDHFPGMNPKRMNHLSNTVFFLKPSKAIVAKYSLATMHLENNGELREYAHAVVMPHINKNILDEFLNDLEEDRAINLG